MIGRLRHALLIAALVLLGPGLIAPADAETCSHETLAAAVDASGAELRSFTAEAQPKLRQKLVSLRDAKKWSDVAYEEKGLAYIHDERIASLDAKADELLTKIDSLGRPTKELPTDCAIVNEVKASGSELLAVMKTKSAYVIDKIDREIGSTTPTPTNTPSSGTSATPPAATAETRPPIAVPAPVPASPPAATAQAPPPKVPGKIAKAEPAPTPPPSPVPSPQRKTDTPQTTPAPSTSERSSSWSTSTAEVPSSGEEGLPGEPYVLPPDQFANEQDGYTIDEIKEATRGFFGTISTSLASVIEHAFRKSGRPTAYVLGSEGGGAILAGLRYGEGTMYLRAGGTQKVYWHGPSIGYDLGADDSRTLFLIYRMHQPDGIFRQFTGLDGTAYFVGGVGITFLKGGEVLMAPIRSGLGLRLGASIGYVRFTPRPTWNPF